MAGTSISSDKREDLVNETVVTSEKAQDFVSDREKMEQIASVDSEKSDFNEYVETAEDSPIEEVRAVVSK